jgi:transposase-like protein
MRAKKFNKTWTADEKERIVKEMIDHGISQESMKRKTGISTSQLWKWKNQYINGGKQALENQRKPGNPMSKYLHKKELTREEQLEFEVMKLRIENERLKKGYIVKGVGQNREFISINNKNLK